MEGGLANGFNDRPLSIHILQAFGLHKEASERTERLSRELSATRLRTS